MRTMLLLVTTVLLAGAMAGCTARDGGDDDEDENGNGGGGEANRVEAQDNEFEPKRLEVAAGTTVTFENVGDNDHTVTIHHPPDPADEWVHDEELGPGQTTTFTFDEPGTYHVWCRYHGTMLADMAMVVQVEE